MNIKNIIPMNPKWNGKYTNWGWTPEDRGVVNKKGMMIEIPIRTINPIIP